MTPDTIITAEILAGLDKCPFCNEDKGQLYSHWRAAFECGTCVYIGKKPENFRSYECSVRERDALRARVKELEEALNQIANQDYRGNRSVESKIAYAALKKGTK